MKRAKKVLAIMVAGPILLIVFVYVVLAGFLWWNENALEVLPAENHALYQRLKEPHQVLLIDDGLESLVHRIDLIDSAEKSLELEFFIYELDLASKLITHKIIAAARRGVKVKLLVDFSAPVFQLRPVYAQFLQQKGIEVRYYNTAVNYRFVSVQHRSHRKLLIVDGKVVVTGGRNIGDDYFNLSHHYNFLDSDLLIEGPIVGKIQESFYTYWDSDLSSRPVADKQDAFSAPEIKEFTRVKAFFSEDEKLASFYGEMGDTNFFQKHKFSSCNDITFASDFPGVMLSNRQVYLRLSEFLLTAKESVFGESPYFVLRNDGLKLLKEIQSKGVKQTYLTNSLYSTDAFYTVAATLPALKPLEEAGIKLHVYSGQKPDNIIELSAGSSKRWGLHAKRAVVDGRHVVIGTYNVDPRSANLNSELLVICRDSPDLAKQVLASLNSRKANSWPLFGAEKRTVATLLRQSDFKQKLLFFLVIPLSNFFNFLL